MKSSAKNLKIMVYSLVVLSIVTFWTGFLQSTSFEFVIYTFYFILFVVGVRLMVMTLNSKATGVLKGLLLLTGFSSTAYMLFFVFAAIGSFFSSKGVTEILTSLEGLLYLDSLAFLVGLIGSIVFLQRKGGHDSSERQRGIPSAFEN